MKTFALTIAAFISAALLWHTAGPIEAGAGTECGPAGTLTYTENCVDTGRRR